MFFLAPPIIAKMPPIKLPKDTINHIMLSSSGINCQNGKTPANKGVPHKYIGPYPRINPIFPSVELEITSAIIINANPIPGINTNIPKIIAKARTLTPIRINIGDIANKKPIMVNTQNSHVPENKELKFVKNVMIIEIPSILADPVPNPIK